MKLLCKSSNVCCLCVVGLGHQDQGKCPHPFWTHQHSGNSQMSKCRATGDYRYAYIVVLTLPSEQTSAAGSFFKEIPCIVLGSFCSRLCVIMFHVLYIPSSGSHDTTIRLWDLIAGKTRATLTNHKKSVRALVLHPRQYVEQKVIL